MTTPAALSSRFRIDLVARIYNLSTSDILTYFDQVTLARERRANKILQDYLAIKNFLFFTTILLVIAEGLFIFYPLARNNLKNAENIFEMHKEEERLKKFSEIGESFSRAMHEINNPLTVISVKANKLDPVWTLLPECIKALDLINVNVDRILKIIKSTKAFIAKVIMIPNTRRFETSSSGSTGIRPDAERC
jgi:signal transduction histidine kinase